MNRFLACLFGVVFFGALAASGWGAEGAKPHLIYIMADDCTYRDMEVYGGQARTPNLLQLRDSGMRFDRCFQAAPMCSPTRHNLYTGLYPVRSGAHPNHTFVRPGTRSVAHYLTEAGYRVALAGKTHINPPEAFPFERVGKGKALDFGAMGRLFAEAVAQEQPVALFVCSNEPHTPWNLGDPSAYPPDSIGLPPMLVDTPETREAFSRYLAEITYFDWEVGQVLEQLAAAGLAENSVVMVTSEQGNAFPFAKWTCYDVGLASGMIVRWPNVVEAGSVTSAFVEYVDVLPTFLEIAGAPIPEALEGRSFLGVLKGERRGHKEYVYGLQTTRGIINGSEAFGIRTVRKGRYRYIRNLNPDVKFTNAVTKEGRQPFWASWVEAAASGDAFARQQVDRYHRRPAVELYDCEADPWNQRNLAGDPSLRTIEQDLGDKLREWMAWQGDQGAETERQAHRRSWSWHRKNQ